MKDILKEYIVKEYGIENFEEIIKKNYLNYIYTDEPHNIKLLLNKANVMLLQNELIKICKNFDEQKIKYITFKGAVLANRLYDNIYKRFFSDIDIFVFPQHFEEALNILYNNGYVLRYPDDLSNPHHVVLKNGKINVELHKNILNPFTEIDETYMYNHTETFSLSKQDVITFDLTATFLHLLYHLYMDAWLSLNYKYLVYATMKTPTIKRFFFQAYEIALLSKNHFEKINWNEIIKDVKKQKFRAFFKTMIFDILEIFPNIFPKHFINTVNDMQYINSEHIILYKYISSENLNTLLCDFINSQWNNNASKNLQIDSIGRFSLTNPIIKELETNNSNRLTCDVQIERNADGIKIVFKISNDDFHFSEINDYNTQTSDGVHLIICGTKKYSYNSIFLFPKIISNKTVVIPVNVLNGDNSIISDLLISTSYQKFETEYLITVILKNEFLKINNIEEYFYLGLVISDCSSKTKKRKSELILSTPHSEWYNPAYFAKIKIH